MSGGGGQTSTTSNAPPQQYLDAYTQVLQRANQAASAPYQNYPGQLQAGFSPQQEQAFNVIGSSVGEQAPYLNAASQDFTNATAPLQPLMQPYVDEAQNYYQAGGNQNLQGALSPYQTQAGAAYGQVQNSDLGSSVQPYLGAAAQGFGQVGNTNLQGAISPSQQLAYQGFGQGSQTLTPQQYSGQAVNNYYSPYQQDVVNATQKQFDLSNATQQTQLQGNAASQGALGGDRVGVAQAALAGQQQAQQAPVIAGLENQGFGQAQQEFNNQQQTNLSAQQQSEALKQQAAQGYLGIGNQSLSAAQQQAALRAQAAQGFAGLGSENLSAQQAQEQAQMQAASGYAGLGGQSLTAAQQQASLYNQSAQGFGSLGQAELGAGQSQGWLNAQAGSGLAGLGNEALSGTLASGSALLGAGALQQQQAQQSLNIPYQQWQAQQSFPYQQTGWLSNIAQGLGSQVSGSSTTAPGPSTGSQVLGGVGLAGLGGYAAYQGGLFGSAAGAGAGLATTPDLLTATGATFKRGGAIGFAGGGDVPDVSMNGFNVGDAPGSQSVIEGGDGIPSVSASVVPTGPMKVGTSLLKRNNYGSTSTSSGDSNGFLGEVLGDAAGVAAGFSTGNPGVGLGTRGAVKSLFQRGGHVPIASRGFAAGGAPAINVTTVPNARGVGVPTMSVNSNSDAVSPLNAYLSQTAAGAYHPPATPPPAPAPGPAASGPGQLTSDQTQQVQKLLQAEQDAQNWLSNGGGNNNGSMAGGGMVRGFDDGGATDDDFNPPSVDFGRVDDQPVGQRFSDWLHGTARDDQGQAIPIPPVPPGEHNDKLDTPVARMIVPFLKDAWNKQQENDTAFNAQTAVKPNRAANLLEHSSGVDESVANPDAGEPPPSIYNLTGDQDALMNGRTSGFGPSPETHGGDWQPGLSRPDPTTPAGPNRTTTAGGFGSHGPAGPAVPDSSTTLASSSSAPAASGFAAYNDPMPWNPATMGFGSKSNSRSSDLDDTRALKEDKANPLISLAIAAAGMMAGTSPHAMTNIGQGALAGLGNYVKTDQAAKELAAKVEENKVRLAETQAYHGITGKVAQQNADTKSAAQGALAAYRAFKSANPTITSAALAAKTSDYLMGTVNPETGDNYTQDEAYRRVKGFDRADATNAENSRHHLATEVQGDQRIQNNQQAIMNSDAYRQQLVSLRGQGLDQGAAGNIMTNATRMVAADITGKLTLDAAVKQQLAGRATVANPATPAAGQPAAAKLLPPPDALLSAAKAAIAGGKDRNAVIQRLQAGGYDPSGL